MDRSLPKSLQKRWNDPKGLIQVFTGPRQVGKTTAVLHLKNDVTAVYASADLPSPPSHEFIEEQWKNARKIHHPERTLILDEVQKIPNWSDVVKGLWDEDHRNKIKMRVCLLGSSSLLIEKGLSESLTGRFEVSYFPHWTFKECRDCFKATLEDYTFFGGYPKAYDFSGDRERFISYLQDSIIEPTLGRDILSLHSVDKPSLLRQLFWYVSRLPSQTVSFEKILGHLQGRGNSATLVHYAELLQKAFLLIPLSKFSRKPHRTKRSIPKWIIPNPALVETSIRQLGPTGFVFENLVGSHIVNLMFGRREFELQYLRESGYEVDFIVTKNNEPIFAMEVKSGRLKGLPTAEALKKHGVECPFKVVSKENIEEFLSKMSIEEILTSIISG